MIRAVLFDMDGVLVDTEWFYNRRRYSYLKERGFSFREIPDFSGSNEKAIWEYLVPHDEELRESLRKGYDDYQKEHPTPYEKLLNPVVKDVMESLHGHGIKLAVASSSNMKLIQEVLDIAKISECLDYIISGYQCSAFKPNPEIYIRAMKELRVNPWESLVVEDSPLGIEAGKKSGAVVWALRPHEGIYLDQSNADRIIDSLLDIVVELCQ